jgi:hypothetical protein
MAGMTVFPIRQHRGFTQGWRGLEVIRERQPGAEVLILGDGL